MLADDFTTLGEVKGRLVAGFDVGRKRDLSELAVFEEADGKKECRLIRSYDRVPFAEQEADLRRLLAVLPIARLSIDQNGLGMHLAENLRRDFAQVVPETFTNEAKETWAAQASEPTGSLPAQRLRKWLKSLYRRVRKRPAVAELLEIAEKVH